MFRILANTTFQFDALRWNTIFPEYFDISQLMEEEELDTVKREYQDLEVKYEAQSKELVVTKSDRKQLISVA